MSNLNDIFLEEFKRLDKLCKEMYRTDTGVTTYINEMKRVPASVSRAVPGWNADLKQLISLRHLRNHLSHDVGTLDKTICTKNDIDWLKAFYKRLYNQSDPLTLLYKRNKNKPQKAKTAGKHHKSTHKLGCLTAAAFIACIAILIALIVKYVIK